MKDLDFDELDQAVSSVLGTNAAQDEPKPADAPVTPAPAAKPETATPAPAPAPVAAAPAPSPTVSPTVRRRGQFLDMVHPASKMTASPATTPAARKKVAPVSADIAAAPAAIAVATPAETVEETPAAPATPPASTPDLATPPAGEPAWPDPLDVMDEPVTKKEDAPEDAPTVTEPEQPAAPAAAAPATTPFVTDAKVDKRPLDAFAGPDDALKTDDASAEKPAAEEVKSDTPAAVEPVEAVKPDTKDKDTSKPPIIDTTPPELQPEVVSVESDAGNELVDPNNPETPEVPETPMTPASGLSQSIPQQYKTPAEKPDEAPHPIFDTNEYHQPLLPATNKKSRGWLVIVIIVLLLIVGAALGYFAFMAGF